MLLNCIAGSWGKFDLYINLAVAEQETALQVNISVVTNDL